MKTLLTTILALMTCVPAAAFKYSYTFSNTPISKALVRISKDHPEVNISFIYKELDRYHTSAHVQADDADEALRQTIGRNPISVISKGGSFYVEALQRGRYVYCGRAMGNDKAPVASATVMLLSPKDSTVLTYGMTDDAGRFSIPCDSRGAIAKLSRIGYKTTFHACRSFSVGDIVMPVRYVMVDQARVEGQMAAVRTDRTAYIPDARQKNAAQNGIELLRQMAIPQIRIDPVSKAVTDNAGMSVALFINHKPASKEDMEGLKTTDVRRVEYLEFPTDPRFRGAQRAVNIVAQEYVYGGYTKVTADESLLTGLDSNAGVYSKFSYKKMTYDLYLGAAHKKDRHVHTDLTGTYTLTDDAGEPFTPSRREATEKTNLHEQQYPVTFRASYDTEKAQISNTIGFSRQKTSMNEQSGTVHYVPEAGEALTFGRKNPTRSNLLSYNGTYYFMLPRDVTLNIEPKVSYTYNHSDLTYSTSASAPIVRNARENACSYRVDAYLRKRIAQKHSLALGPGGGDIINRLHYQGNTVYRDRFHNSFVALMAYYQFTSPKFTSYVDHGYCWERSAINSLKTTDSYPFLHIHLSYKPTSKKQASVYFQFASTTPGIDMKVSDLLPDNEFMYITGNPHLQGSRLITLSPSFLWLPSSRLTLNAYGQLYEEFDRQIMAYEAYDGGRALLRTYTNDGNFLQSEIGLAAKANFLDSKLQLYVSPKYCFDRSTGTFDKTHRSFGISAQILYYLKQFHFLLYYRTAERGIYDLRPTTYRTRDYYSFEAGWGKGNWNVRVAAYNIFRRHWDCGDRTTESPLYTQHQTEFGTSFHARLGVTLTYTIDYGKKVQRTGEVGEQSGAASAILK